MKSRVDLARDILGGISEREAFLRALTWFNGASTPTAAASALAGYHRHGVYPHAVLAWSQAVIRTHEHLHSTGITLESYAA